MQKNKYIQVLFLLFVPAYLFAQINLEGAVFDALTRQPVPFCAIGIKHSSRGCLGNEEGVFKINNVNRNDTLVVSNITYYKKEIVISDFIKTSQIFIEPKQNQLTEIVIFDKDDYLYRLFDKCRTRLLTQKEEEARAYFVLETKIAQQPVELLECYYNAAVNASSVSSFKFKNGRVGLATYNDRYFVNLNTSKAITFLSLSAKSEHMPQLPFQLGLKKLKKHYRLALRQVNGTQNPIYEIAFSPIDTNGAFFKGSAWIELNSGQLQQITLLVNSTKTHPFLPFDPLYARIEDVSMQITKSFQSAGKPDHIDFNYQLTYHHLHTNMLKHENPDTLFQVNSNGVVYFYDYGKPFYLPNFKYNEDIDDYRKITSLSFNQWFWDANNTLVYSNNRKKELAYFKKNGLLLNYQNSLKSGTNTKTPFFEPLYHVWSGNQRLRLKQDGIRNDTSFVHNDQPFISQRYRFKAQIFLDINPNGDSLQHYSASIFDGTESYYNLHEEPATNCFMNLYFDLVEIERRKMESLITKNNFKASQVDSLYKLTVSNIEAITNRYFAEVGRGKNLVAFEKWNNLVKQNLGIDNFELFGINRSE